MATKKGSQKKGGSPRRSYRRKPAAPRRRRRLSAGRASMKAASKDVLGGAIGGAVAAFVLANVGFVQNQSDTNKALIIGAASLLTGVMAKQPAAAAGMAGVAATYLLKGTGVLADGSMSIPRIAAGGGSMPLRMVPTGLAGGADYANLNDNVYASGYANQY